MATGRELTTDTNDFVIRENRLSVISGVNELATRLTYKLQTFQGELFTALDVGIPYYQEIFARPADIGNIESIFKTAILDEPGVESIDTFELDFEGATRKLTLTAGIIADDGSQVEITI